MHCITENLKKELERKIATVWPVQKPGLGSIEEMPGDNFKEMKAKEENRK